MSLQINKGRSLVSKQKLVGVFLAIFALFIQPLVALNIPSVFAADATADVITVTPSSLSIDGGYTKGANANTSSHSDVKLSFDYDIQDLEAGEQLLYGWSAGQGSTVHHLGVLTGETNATPSEIGAVSNVALPAGASISNLVLSFSNNGANSSNDTVQVSNITLSGASSTPVNHAPVITSNGGGHTALVNVEEGEAAITTVVASDEDGDLLTYSLDGVDKDKFTIGSDGVLAFASAPSYDVPTDANGDNAYEVTVVVSDGKGATGAQSMTVTVVRPATTPVSQNTVTLKAHTADSITLNFTVTSTDLPGASGIFETQIDNDTVREYAFPVGTTEAPFGDVDSQVRVREQLVTEDFGEVWTEWQTFYVLTPDTAAPAAPTIKTPTARQWFKATPISTSWTAVTDPSGIDTYQIAYAYDDNHSFSGSTCPGVIIDGKNVYCRDASGTSRNHSPSSNEQGGVTIWVRAIDNASNVGSWSKSVHYYYDHTDPTTNIVVPAGFAGKTFTISGDAKDNLSLNRVYVQLINRQNSQRYGGTTIDLIGKGENAHWSKTFDAEALNLPEGDYAAHVSVVDMAGNTGSAGWTANFTLDKTVPTISINTGTGADNGSLGTHPYYRQISFKLHDPRGGLKEVVLNGHVYPRSNEWNDLNWLNITKSHLIEGENTIFVRDRANNQSATTTFVYDSKAPVASIAVSSPTGVGSLHRNTVKVTGTVEASEQNIKSHWFEVVGPHGVATQYSYTMNTSDLTYSFNLDTSAGNGEYKIRYVATDKAGNRSDATGSVIRTITVDNSAPSIDSVSYSNSGNPTNKAVVVTITTSESVATPAGWDKVSDTTFKKTYSSDQIDSVAVSDLAGNSSAAKTITVTGIDIAPPAIPVIFSADSTGVDGTGEAGSTITIYVDGVIVGTTIVGSNGMWSHTFFPALSTSSPHSITATATDAAGNVSDSSSETALLAIVGRSVVLRGIPDQITPLAAPSSSLAATRVSPQASSATIAADEEDAGEVLGTETKSTPLEQTAALSPSTEGWKVWGVAWYWYLLAAALIVGSWWLIAGRRRRRAQEEF